MIVENDHGTTLLSGLKEMSDSEIKKEICKLESDGKIISIKDVSELRKDVRYLDKRTIVFTKSERK